MKGWVIQTRIYYGAKNGKFWEESDPNGASFAGYGSGVAYGTTDGINQLWVAGSGTGTNNILWSENGKFWEESDSTGASLSVVYDIAYGTSDGTCPLWVAAGYGIQGSLMWSENGKFWNMHEGPSFSFTGNGVAYRKNGTEELWIAVGHKAGPGGGELILNSKDGKNWNKSTVPSGFTFGADVAFDHLLYGMKKDYYHPQ